MLNCTSAGPHLNPYSKELVYCHTPTFISIESDAPHGPPTGNLSTRHVGDLGNVTSDIDGVIIMDLTDSIIQLFKSTPQFIGNRTLVLHAMRDDGGSGGFPDSNSTGFVSCNNDITAQSEFLLGMPVLD